MAGEVGLRQAAPPCSAWDLQEEGPVTVQVVEVQHVASKCRFLFQREPFSGYFRQNGEPNESRHFLLGGGSYFAGDTQPVKSGGCKGHWRNLPRKQMPQQMRAKACEKQNLVRAQYSTQNGKDSRYPQLLKRLTKCKRAASCRKLLNRLGEKTFSERSPQCGSATQVVHLRGQE